MSAEDFGEKVCGPSSGPQIGVYFTPGAPFLGASFEVQPPSAFVSPDCDFSALGVSLVGRPALGHRDLWTYVHKAGPVGQHQTGHLLAGLLRPVLQASCTGEASSVVPH